MVHTAKTKERNLDNLGERFYNILLEHITSDGILASSRQEKFGCVFGRDSAISVLGILKNLEEPPPFVDSNLLLSGSKTALLKLVDLQGRETNIESGEQPGKFIHEYRENNFGRLVNRERPWYVYPDGKLRNYDSIDSTPLTLIAIHRLWKQTGDNEFLLKALPAVEKGLNWIISYGDLDSDGLLEYELPEERVHGGLPVQSWTDSAESLLDKNGKFPKYPIAPVEVQGFAWLALKIWADFYKERNLNFENSAKFGRKLEKKAEEMKKRFNEAFFFEDQGLIFAAQALDGNKNQIQTITGNPLLLLWATYERNGADEQSEGARLRAKRDKGGPKVKEAIIEDRYIEDLVKRAFLEDMFDPAAGIRTMSTKSPTYNPGAGSYHNGSFWPMLNGMIYEGLLRWNFKKKALALEEAMIMPLRHFGLPVEVLINNGHGYELYRSSWGDLGCSEQTWTITSTPWIFLLNSN